MDVNNKLTFCFLFPLSLRADIFVIISPLCTVDQTSFSKESKSPSCHTVNCMEDKK